MYRYIAKDRNENLLELSTKVTASQTGCHRHDSKHATYDVSRRYYTFILIYTVSL